MTFRTRLVLVATAAVLVVVLIGSLATYVVAYYSLVGSLDVTLQQDARNLISGNEVNQLPVIQNTCGRAQGYCSQIVWADGKVYPGDSVVITGTTAKNGEITATAVTDSGASSSTSSSSTTS